MRSTQKLGTRKILVNVWLPLLDSLNKKVEVACLRRDQYLDRIFRAELDELEGERAAPNSPAAKACVADHFAHLNCRSISLNLSHATISKLNQLCEEKNIVRDAFINRVLLCLVAKPKILEILFPIEEYREQVFEYWDRPGHAYLWQPLDTMGELVNEPFSFIRECLGRAREEEEDDNYTFYQAHVPDGFFGEKVKGTLGLNVFLPDHFVPGHPAERELLDDLIVDIPSDATRRGKEAL